MAEETTAPSPPRHGGDPRQNHWVTLALLTIAGLSFALMQTLVMPALPAFQREFGTTASGAAWIATAFLLSASVLTPIAGKLGDAHGKQRVLFIALVIFGLASLGAATAWNLGSLIFFRVLQGVGGAVFPLSFGIIRDEFPPERVGVGVGTVSSVFGLGGGVGLVMSGVVLEFLDWPWLFLIGGVPVLVAAALIHRYVPESPIKAPARPDYLGGAALSFALVALLLGLSLGSDAGWASAPVLALFAAAAVLFPAWVAIELRVPEPLVDMRTFAHRGMAATNSTTFLIGFAMFASFILLPIFLRIPGTLPEAAAQRIDYGFGASPIEVGLFFIPSSVAMMIGGPLAGALGDRLGAVRPLRAGMLLGTLALALLAVAHSETWMIYAWMALFGLGLSFSFASLGALVIQHAPAGQTGVASGMNTIMRTVGGAFGAQIAGIILAANTLEELPVPTEGAFTGAFAMGAAGAALALVPTLLLGRRRPPSRPSRAQPAGAPAGS